MLSMQLCISNIRTIFGVIVELAGVQSSTWNCQAWSQTSISPYPPYTIPLHDFLLHLVTPFTYREIMGYTFRLFVPSVILSKRCLFIYLLFPVALIHIFTMFFGIYSNFLLGCSSMCEVWCQYGGIFLRSLQILWWWGKAEFNFVQKVSISLCTVT